MKFIIGSDIHGSLKYAKNFFERAEESEADQIILLGDLYYCGARNDPPEEYSPKECVALLNSYAERIIAVKGNCESEVDSMVSKFGIYETSFLYVFGKKIFLAHGHKEGFEKHPRADIVFQGHTHVSVLTNGDGAILANPGSISIPKDGTHSYMVMDETGIRLYDLISGELLREVLF